MSNNILPSLKEYQNKWVALTVPDHQVAGSGNDAVEASNDAESKGYTQTILFKVQPFDQFYIPSHYEV